MTGVSPLPALPHGALLVAILAAFAFATGIGGLLARRGFPLPPGERRIGCVDGLRGYLALGVLAHHFIIWTTLTRLGQPWGAPRVYLYNQLGAGSVALFFMTTGLVFYPRVLSGWRRNAWRDILIGRVFRIVPLIAASVAAIMAMLALWQGGRASMEDLPAIARWLTAWGQPPLLGVPESGRLNAYVLWSLWYEWIFYLLLLPACALAMDLRGRLPSWIVPAGFLLVALLSRAVVLPRDLQTFLPLFAIGMVAFEVRRREATARLLARPAMAIPAVAALIAAVLTAPEPYGLPQLLLLGFFFTCVACGNSLGGVLTSRGALVLGECSFGIYLLHGIALWLLFTPLRALPTALPVAWMPLLLPGAAVAVTLLTAATFLGVERPAIRLGRTIASFRRRRDTRLTAPEVDVAP